MQLKEAQSLLAKTAQKDGSALSVLRQLKATVAKAHDYMEAGNTVQCQVLLEQSFTLLMQAMHFLNLDVENVVSREQNRRQSVSEQNPDRVILVFSDHAELRVDGELRGTIPLYAAEDYTELRQIAQLFGCRIENADHLQLDLFTLLQSSAQASS